MSKRVKIISSGSQHKVLVDGKQLSGVTLVAVTLVPNELATVLLKVEGCPLEIDADAELVVNDNSPFGCLTHEALEELLNEAQARKTKES